MADPPVSDTGNEPTGRADPNAGKGPMGISWMMWGIVAVGTFGAVWFLRSRTSTASTTSATTGALSGTDPNSGVTSTDPMTAASLLQEMQTLAQQNAALLNQLTPSNSPAPKSGGDPHGPPVVSGSLPTSATSLSNVINGASFGTSRLSGGSSTAITAVPLKSSPPTTVVSKTINNFLNRRPEYVAPDPAKTIVKPKAGLANISWPWNQKTIVPSGPIPLPKRTGLQAF